MNTLAPHYRIQRSKGFSLTEVLVSVVVLSIGLLGIAGIQVTALRLNHDSYIRSIAVSQVDAMIDRMRANKSGRQSGFYNELPKAGSGELSAQAACDQCTPEELATLDFQEWNLENQTLLPNGQGTITGNGSVFTITVRYDRERTGAQGTNCSGNSAIDLACIRMSVEL